MNHPWMAFNLQWYCAFAGYHIFIIVIINWRAGRRVSQSARFLYFLSMNAYEELDAMVHMLWQRWTICTVSMLQSFAWMEKRSTSQDQERSLYAPRWINPNEVNLETSLRYDSITRDRFKWMYSESIELRINRPDLNYIQVQIANTNYHSVLKS